MPRGGDVVVARPDLGGRRERHARSGGVDPAERRRCGTRRRLGVTEPDGAGRLRPRSRSTRRRSPPGRRRRSASRSGAGPGAAVVVDAVAETVAGRARPAGQLMPGAWSATVPCARLTVSLRTAVSVHSTGSQPGSDGSSQPGGSAEAGVAEKANAQRTAANAVLARRRGHRGVLAPVRGELPDPSGGSAMKSGAMAAGRGGSQRTRVEFSALRPGGDLPVGRSRATHGSGADSGSGRCVEHLAHLARERALGERLLEERGVLADASPWRMTASSE